MISLGSCSAGMQSSLSSILFKELDCVRRICQLIGHPSCPLVKTLGGVALCWSAFRFPSRSIILYDNLRTYLLYTVIATVAFLQCLFHSMTIFVPIFDTLSSQLSAILVTAKKLSPNITSGNASGVPYYYSAIGSILLLAFIYYIVQYLFIVRSTRASSCEI